MNALKSKADLLISLTLIDCLCIIIHLWVHKVLIDEEVQNGVDGVVDGALPGDLAAAETLWFSENAVRIKVAVVVVWGTQP